MCIVEVTFQNSGRAQEAVCTRHISAQDVPDDAPDMPADFGGFAFSHADSDLQNQKLPPVEDDEEHATPYADAMLKAFDELLDSSDEHRALMTRLAKELWKTEPKSGEVKCVKYTPQRPANVKVRLDTLIRRALRVRKNIKRICMKHRKSKTRTCSDH